MAIRLCSGQNRMGQRIYPTCQRKASTSRKGRGTRKNDFLRLQEIFYGDIKIYQYIDNYMNKQTKSENELNILDHEMDHINDNKQTDEEELSDDDLEEFNLEGVIQDLEDEGEYELADGIRSHLN